MNSCIFTSESVSEGHPDKVCDQISDALLDGYLARDPHAKVAIETAATTNRIILMGEVNTQNGLTMEACEKIVRGVIRDIGYEQPGFHWQNIDIQNYIHRQSPEIAHGLGAADEGAGDQGIMFGFACRETPEFMPAPIQLAHEIVRALACARKEGQAPGLGPDAKSQVSVRYEEGIPVAIDTLVVSTQHEAELTQKKVIDLVHNIVKQAIPANMLDEKTRYIINPSGRFIIGGPDCDTGLTGRKIIVDTYGGSAPHGGGAFSGKDPTKVDRSAAYMARYLAKNIVKSGLAERCLIQLSYAIACKDVLSVYVNTQKTGIIPDEEIAQHVTRTFDLSPKGIREILNLNRPIYRPTAVYGHFGRKPSTEGTFSWEKEDLVEFFTDTTDRPVNEDIAVQNENVSVKGEIYEVS